MKIKNDLLIQLDEVGKRENVRVTLTGENCRDIIDYIKKLRKRIHALEEHNKHLNKEAQKYYDMLMECEYGRK